MDLNQFKEMADKLHQRLKEAQDEAAHIVVIGESGGGFVRVTMDGIQQVQKVRIDPALFKLIMPSMNINTADIDIGLLEELIGSAFNEAIGQVMDTVKDQIGDLSKSMGLGSISPADWNAKSEDDGSEEDT